MIIDPVHDLGRLGCDQTPGMLATALVSMTARVSLEPEAPLVQINGLVGRWLAERLNFYYGVTSTIKRKI